MPVLTNQFIFTIIPQRAPFFIRPLLKGVFSTLSSKLVEPRLKANADMVRLSPSTILYKTF